MNSWDAFNQYEALQRQRRIEKERELAEQQRLSDLEAIQQQALREQERHALEQRIAEQQQLAMQQTTEQQRLKDEMHKSVLSQLAESLQSTNQQIQEAQLEATRKFQLEAIVRKQGSPIENSFYEEWHKQFPAIELKRQYPIGKYRVDFAHVETKTVIELDGYEYHHKKKDRNKDYARQHDIEDWGWIFVRFTGSQIFSDVESCTRFAYKRIMVRQGEVR